MKRLNVMLDEELHTQLKMTAFEKGITMSQYVTDLLKKELNKEDRKEKSQED